MRTTLVVKTWHVTYLWTCSRAQSPGTPPWCGVWWWGCSLQRGVLCDRCTTPPCSAGPAHRSQCTGGDRRHSLYITDKMTGKHAESLLVSDRKPQKALDAREVKKETFQKSLQLSAQGRTLCLFCQNKHLKASSQGRMCKVNRIPGFQGATNLTPCASACACITGEVK